MSEPAILVRYDESLPINTWRREISETIRDHQVVVIAGETGSGKTTQLPKFCLELGRRSIGHTQPRRIAARTVAERIAEELETTLGDLVGYQVRFTRKSSRATRLKVMTDGVLLAEIAHDRDLRRYDTIIVDEAHERSLNIDFLLGYLRQLTARRPDLKVIITSATIDTERFAQHFSRPDGTPAPIIEVSGRTFPVEVRYRPLLVDGEVDQNAGIVDAARELQALGDGDILVFLSGEREIRDATEALNGARLRFTEVLPLYARLSAAEQHKIFSAHAGRRIVLATNVAETSLTVPGIRYVIDTGTARISRYSARTKVQRLPIEPISQASANQRAGRCGRVAPGVCIRLYDEEDFEARPAFTEPEILRTNLASVILQMTAADLGDIASFPFVEPPDRTQITDGLRLLDELGALAPAPVAAAPGPESSPTPASPTARTRRGQARLTPIGRQLSALPLDPRMARMLLAAAQQGCLREMLVVVSGLSIVDPRERPADQQEKADALHRRFWNADESADGAAEKPGGEAAATVGGAASRPLPSGGVAGRSSAGMSAVARHEPRGRRATDATAVAAAERAEGGDRAETRLKPGAGEATSGTGGSPRSAASDFLSLVNLWNYLREQQRERSGNAFRRMCREEYLHFLRIREWQDLHAQLKQITRELGLDRNDDPAPADRVHTAALTGLLSNVGLADLRVEAKPTAGKRPRRGQQEYLGARGTKFAINPGSSLARTPPPLVMAAEIVETTRLWARTVAPITAEQVEEVAGHLLKRSYAEPHWSARAGAVLAYETVTLFGVPIVSGRPVGYGKIEPAEARTIFLRSALVEGQWRTRHHFFRDNQSLREEVEALQDRARRRDLVVDDEVILAFYDARVPADITTVAHFDAWWRKARQDQPDLLTLTLDDLTTGLSEDPEHQFPGRWPLRSDDPDGPSLDLSYVFDPTSERDGVIAAIPLSLLSQLDPAPFSWQVPGLRAELATELVRSLPKALRRELVPAPEFASRALGWLAQHPGPTSEELPAALARALRLLTGVQLGPGDWNLEAVPRHLRMTFDVIPDRGGAPLATGKDLGVLQRELAPQVSRTLTTAARALTRSGATSWDFGPLAAEVTLERAGHQVTGYPALVDEGSSVGIAVLESAQRQAAAHTAGVRRLVLLNTPDPTRWVVSHLGNRVKLGLGASPYPGVPALLADARLASVGALIARHAEAPVRDAATFARLCDLVRADNPDFMRGVVDLAAESVRLHGEAVTRLPAVARVSPAAADDLTEQLANLVFAGFLSATAYAHLIDLPRYLRAASLRIDTLLAQPARDRQPAETIVEIEDAYAVLCAAQPPGPLAAPVAEIGWLIEELRVGLFAQSLRTKVTVSAKRVRNAISAIGVHG